jgi:outer membrane protein
MRNSLSAVLVPLLLALAPAARAETKIAFVDFERAGNECDEGKAANAALMKVQEEKMKPVKDKQVEFENLRAEFEKQQAVLSNEAKQQKGMDLQKKNDELQQMYMQAQQELQQKNIELIRVLGDHVSQVVKEIAEKEGIQMVINKSALVYAPDAMDLTNEVIRKANARFPAKAAPGTPTPAAAATDPKAKTPPAPKPQKPAGK